MPRRVMRTVVPVVLIILVVRVITASIPAVAARTDATRIVHKAPQPYTYTLNLKLPQTRKPSGSKA